MPRTQHERWLLELTSIPTAAGREDRVIAWIEDWVARRRDLRLQRDPDGNLLITQRRRGSAPPIFITAHLDHPAFVVREVVDRRELVLEFRGGVHTPYFEDAPIEVIDADDVVHRGKLTSFDAKAKPFKVATARLSRATDDVAAGDIARWRLGGLPNGESVVRRGRLHAHACDDLAAAAAALATLDVVRKRKGAGHVGLLFTLAEEIGFVGAIGACKHRTVPDEARLICLENSRSFDESPIGGGPILRVGDRISVFEPTLTNEIGLLMMQHQQRHEDYRWQRKLMPGGACEATTFSTFGYRSTCICLPLGNYHNMRDIDGVLAGARPAKMGPEIIAVDDYHGMIEMLVLCATKLHSAKLPSIAEKMDAYYEALSWVVER